MNRGLINFDWNKVENLKEEEISYFLYLEGKSISAISKIRNLDSQTVQRQIIESKIRHRYLVNIKSSKDVIELFRNMPKEEKNNVLLSLDITLKNNLVDYINREYGNMNITDKSTAIWIIGELKEDNSIGILLKGSVHKAVLVRRMAISAMGKINSNKCEEALIRALSDENPQVVTYAINSLIKLNSAKAREKILELRKSDKSSIIRAIEKYEAEIKLN